MPLTEKSYSDIKSSVSGPQTPKISFLVFYSSVVDGKMWCPDCVDVESTVRDAFDGADKPDAMLYYVGKKEEWRTPENVARVDWKVNSIPTVIRLEEGKETARLVEAEILDGSKWQAFIKV